jgi:hypothetical protein
MAIFSRVPLSESPNGVPIAVAATSTPGTLIHSAIGATNAQDEIYLEVANITSNPVTLTLEWGGVLTVNHLVDSLTIPPNSPPLSVACGQMLNGGLVVRAYASVANALTVTGKAYRIQ